MLGTLRFFLACVVALSHMHGAYLPLNLGGTAVVIFYFISGYLMNRSYQRFASPLAFYKDRVIRIFPVYLVALAVALPVLYIIGRLPADFSIEDILANVLVVPLNYYVTSGYTVIRPAWSLASELHFYALVPLLFLLRGRILALGAIALTVVHIAAFFAAFTVSDTVIGGSGSTWLAYRLPFSIVAVFVAGFISAESDDDSRYGLRTCWAFYVLFFFVLGQVGRLTDLAMIEISLGAVIAPPLVAAAINLPSIEGLDRILGGLAYPLFLTHIIAQQFVEFVTAKLGWGRLPYVLLAWVLSLGSAYLLWWFVDKPMGARRYKSRGFDQIVLKSAEPVTALPVKQAS